MSKSEIIEKWKSGVKQADIARNLGVGPSYVSQVLAPLKNQIGGDITKKETSSSEIKRIFERIHRNLKKAWGYDNKMGREKKRPKYRNLWEDWEFFKDWFESLP